jgi:hypothetical protein
MNYMVILAVNTIVSKSLLRERDNYSVMST